MKYARPKGTKDFVPPESARKQRAEGEFRRLAGLYGFQEVVTPIIESTELFIKSSGETSDIVTKEMYTFKDRGDRSITLRPEGTPGVVRALLENNLRLPCRLYYVGPTFRYVRPQKGRYREFYQLGVESFGEASPDVDAEVIALGFEYFRAVGIRDCEPQVNSIGCRECRPAYNQKLRDFLAERQDRLCADCRVRSERNPLRVFDCKSEACQAILNDAPRSKDNLCSACAGHFASVQSALGLLKVPYVLNDRMVRGLDYYSRTAFEYVSRTIGAQDSLGGGGRYDYLVEDFGGPATPAIGFALGEERALLAAGERAGPERTLVFVVALSEAERPSAIALLSELRSAGITARMDFDHPKAGRQFKSADASGARYCVILGSDEVARGAAALKDLKTGRQEDLAREQLAQRLSAAGLTEPGSPP